MGAKYCDQRVCLSVCLSLSAGVSIKQGSTSPYEFGYTLHVTVVLSLSCDSAVRYVLPVLDNAKGAKSDVYD